MNVALKKCVPAILPVRNGSSHVFLRRSGGVFFFFPSTLSISLNYLTAYLVLYLHQCLQHVHCQNG